MKKVFLPLVIVLLLASPTSSPPSAPSEAHQTNPKLDAADYAEETHAYAPTHAREGGHWFPGPVGARLTGFEVPFQAGIESPSGRRGVWWVFFRNKSPMGQIHAARAVRNLAGSLTDRAKDRRLRTTGSLALDARDLPVYAGYIDALKETGAKVRGASRWLNAASVYATSGQLQAISELPFVKSVKPVAAFRRKMPEAVEPAIDKEHAGPRHVPTADPAYYNRTYNQLQQLNIPAVHDLGYTGAGVLICMLDTGYNLRHEALINLDVIAERDFIQGDNVTSNQPGDYPTQHDHGTITMSTIGGFKPNEFVGGAPDAQFALAKTEIVDQEIIIEEDYYVMGLEWGDSLGASIVSSSLGYLDWYTYADMDGQTAITTNGADIAASKGITVVTAMGNQQSAPWHYLIAPSDADTVIAVGAVDIYGNLASFSSVGPTYDGRIKPDVVACGLSTSAASPWDSTGYVLSGGTSLSTPLIGASAALLSQAHPDWGPVEIRNALRFSADQAFSPDTARGWGVPDVLAVLEEFADAPLDAPAHSAYSHPNPFRTRMTLYFTIGVDAGGSPGDNVRVSVSVYDIAGRLVRTLFAGHLPAGPHSVEWDGRDSKGHPSPSGVYMLKVRHPGGVHGAKTLLIR